MINKIGVSPAFTSKVNVLYDGNRAELGSTFYNSKECLKELNKLTKNGDDNFVTLSPYDEYGDSMLLNIVEKRKGKLYQGQVVVNNPEDIAKRYSIALHFMKEVPQDVKVKKFMA